jgi:hypothetical protein
MKTIVEQILKEIKEKSIVLAEDDKGGIWLLGGHEPVEDDKQRTELIVQIIELSEKHGNDMEFGTGMRKLINNFAEKQKALSQPISDSE